MAIDFTLSNGHPKDKKSLHYTDPITLKNCYTDAITSVVSILENYDSDKLFPTYGFGGRIPDSRNVSHCFSLNGDIFRPECDGTNGILHAYYESIEKVELYGPTHFSSILKFVNGCAH